MSKPLSNYERWRQDEAEWSGAAAEDERRIREAIAIDEAAFAAATARQEAWDLYTIDGEEIHLLNPWMKSVLDEAGQ